MTVEQLWRAGAESWPDIPLDLPRFGELVAVSIAQASHPVDAGELYLACAWSEGVPAASRAFDRTFLPPLRRRLGRMNLSDADIDEVAQRVRERLLRREADGRTTLVKYAGQGKLHSFLIVVGTRIAIDWLRETKRERSDSDALMELATPSDPEADAMRRQSRAVFKSSFEAAVEALAPRERTALRLHLIDGLKVEEIADFYRVHRVTVSRWLGNAREKLLERTRHVARERFGLSGSEFDDAYTGSRLSLSLDRLLSD